MKNRKGERFGRLVAESPADKGANGQVRWLYRCYCGGSKVMYPNSAKLTRHCGCLTKRLMHERFITHGMSQSKLYKLWHGMVSRCRNPKHSCFEYYGGRGVTVCDRWLKFENFLSDMGPRPKGKTLDRLDNNKGYSPDNCAWRTRTEQHRNKRNNRIIDGKPLFQWIDEASNGISYGSLKSRLQRGWRIQEAVTVPLKLEHRHRAKS